MSGFETAGLVLGTVHTARFALEIASKALPREISADTPRGNQKFGLNIIYSPDAGTPVELEIIAVHGRNGHSIKSWVDSGTGFSWLEEVQQRFPNARIMSYGYEAQIFNEAYSQPGSSSQHRDSHSGTLEQIATDFIQELGTKFDECSTAPPIAFVGHDMGGLLVKMTLVLSHRDPKTMYLSRRCCGIIFFGTPHRGIQYRAMLVWNKLRCDDMLPQQDELDVNGSGHYYRDCEFRDIALHMGYKIISFYETSASWQGQLVVDKNSATLAILGEEMITLQSTHANMCKFQGSDDAGFLNLLQALNQLLNHKPLRERGVCIALEKLQSDIRGSFLAEVNEFYSEVWHDGITKKDNLSVRPSVSFTLTIDELCKTGPRRVTVAEKVAERSLKYRWIHIPANNMSWVAPCVCATFEGSEPTVALPILDPRHWLSKQQKARHNAPHGRFMEPSCIAVQDCDYERNGKPVRSPKQLAIFFPYIHWDTYKSFSERAAVYKTLTTGSSESQPHEQRSPRLQELNLAKAYLSSTGELSLHTRRTLHQFFYSHLLDTTTRDNGQTIIKPTAIDQGGAKMIMVDQLWLWVIGNDSVITFFPAKEKEDTQPIWKEADLKQNILDEACSNSTAGSSDTFELATRIVEQAATAVLGKTTNCALKFFECYREAIGKAADDQTRFFQRFQLSLTNDQGREFVPERSHHQDIHDKHEELNLALKLINIMDELNCLAHVLDIQREVLTVIGRNFQQISNCASWKKSITKKILDRVDKALLGYKAQVKRMRTDAQHTHQAVLTLLDLKQKECSIDEARISRLQAEQTAVQSRSIMIFTFVTIIFLPLSFFTSYFGMNVVQLTGVQGNMTSGRVWAIAGPISFTIILGAFILASDGFRKALFGCPLAGVRFFRRLFARLLNWAHDQGPRLPLYKQD